MATNAKRIVTMGLATLKVGESVAKGNSTDTGKMPTSGMAQQGNVYRDSFSFTTDDPEINEVYCEENDTPLSVVGTLGKSELSFDIVNPSVEDMEKWGYGTKDLTGTKQALKAPKTWVAIEKAIEVTPTQGYKMEIPRANIVASMTGGGKKTEPMLLHVVATVLIPLDSSQAEYEPIIYTEI